MEKDPLRVLKLLVYGMGIVLVGGFAWISGKLLLKAGEWSGQSCKELKLPEHNLPLRDLSFHDGSWLASYDDGKSLHIYRYDTCGKLVQHAAVPGAAEDRSGWMEEEDGENGAGNPEL